MALDGMDLDEWGEVSNTASEQSEQQRERASAALAGIKKTQKDEKKGKKASDLLFRLLVDFLQNPQHDVFLESIFDLLKLDVPSLYCVGILSLVDITISDEVRKEYTPKSPLFRPDPPKEVQSVVFDGKNLRSDIRDRVNAWIEDFLVIITSDPSMILTTKFKWLIAQSDVRTLFLRAMEISVTYFFQSKNISIPASESRAFSLFVFHEIKKRVESIEIEEF